MSFIPECFKSPPFSKPKTIKKKLDTTDERKTEKKKPKLYGTSLFFQF